MDVRVGQLRKLTAEELTFLNCGVGEDSWESLGLQGNPTSPSERKSILDTLWKDWCWSWNSIALAPDAKKWLFGKDPDAGKDWRQERKGTTEGGMVGWHHRHYGYEFESALGVGDGQGSLASYILWRCRNSDTTEQLNWTALLYVTYSLSRCTY